MEENEKKEGAVNTEQIKEETVKTAKEVKETIKNVNIKEDAKATTGFITEMVKKPLVRLKEIAGDNTHKDFKYAIVLVVVWMIAVGIVHLVKGYYSIDSFFTYGFTKNLFRLIKVMVAPLLSVVVMSVIIFILNKNNKKSFVTVLTSVTAANTPTIVASIIGILYIISSSISKLLTPFTAFCSTITVVFIFFASKALFGEEDNSKFLKTFIIIEAIYYVAYLIISYLEIYI